MLSVPQKLFDEIIGHSRQAYPHECCGALVGKHKTGNQRDAMKEVILTFRMENANKDRANDRYEIDPKELLNIEKEARSKGLEVVGFYHSHPDHPDRPSQFDRDRGWPFYSYLIVAVQNGSEISARSWTFEDEKEPFREERMKIGGRE